MHDPDVERWLDAFFASWHARRPVDATFIGVHDYDHALPDFSENGAGDALADMRDLLRRRPDPAGALASEQGAPAPASEHGTALPAAAPDAIGALDLRLARGHFLLQIAEYESLHFHRGNPALYTGEAVFGVLSLLLTDFAPLETRVIAATERLARVPTFLAQGSANVRAAPVAWTERARRECEGALAVLRGGVQALRAGWTRSAVHARVADSFLAAAEQAARAIAAFATWLETTLRHRRADREGCGAELFALYLREGHALDAGAAGIEAYARERLEDAVRALAARVAEAGVRDEAEANARLAALHAPVDAYYARYHEIRDEVQRVAEEHDLVTWPDDPIRFVPRPVWVRTAAPHLYFLFYRSPAAFGRPDVHEVLVTPIDGTMPPDQQAALLRATNDRVIRLNHVIHHGGIGHHVQNGHAHRSASRIGRVAAIDGACRIVMTCGGTMAEGWACYATDLMAESRALTALERVVEARSRIRMCARAIVDVRLHKGRLTIDGAASFYVQQAGMAPDAARAEAVKNSMFPTTALVYLMGRDAIHALRDEVSERLGSRFAPRAFHDALLSHGSIPVSLAAAEVKRRVLEPARIPAGSIPGERT